MNKAKIKKVMLDVCEVFRSRFNVFWFAWFIERFILGVLVLVVSAYIVYNFIIR